jgi:hypothetical protein
VSQRPGSFIDGFPADPSSPDYAIHCVIDGELGNCHALRETSANNGLLYPAYFSASDEERRAWLIPAIRRLHWIADKSPWNGYLAGLVNLLFPDSTSPKTLLPDDVLLYMAEMGPRFQRNGAADCYRLNQVIAGTLRQRKQPMSPELMEALRIFVAHLIDVHCHDPATFGIAWQLWRAPENANDGDPCFSAMVRRSLRSMEQQERVKWKKFWDLRGRTIDAHGHLSEKYRGQLREAVESIGGVVFVSRLSEWMSALAADQPATMSAAGREVLLLLLYTCRSLPDLPIDEALYTLCGVRWRGEGCNRLTKEWLGELLMAIATRPCAKAFACAERLRGNPDMRGFVEVASVYDQLLEETLQGVVEGQPSQFGVDGYDLNSDPDLYHVQVALDRTLQLQKPFHRFDQAFSIEFVWGSVELRIVLAARIGSPDLILTLRALGRRLLWLAEKRKQSQEHLVWSCSLSNVARQLLERGPALGERELIALMECDRKAIGFSEPLFALVVAHVRAHGYSPELVRAMESWHTSMHGTIAAMELRHKIGWLLWFDDVSDIDEASCWSNRLRKDLRGAPAAARGAWRHLIETVSFGSGEKPPKKWLKPAAAALSAVGRDRFCKKMRDWFAPFRSSEALRLTITGRDILRNLMFYALLAEDPGVDEAVSWFALARWKTKKDQACVAKILPTFVYVMIQRSHELAYQTLEAYNRNAQVPLAHRSYAMYEALCERMGHQTTVDRPVDPLRADREETFRKLMARYLNGPGTTVEGDTLLVTGVVDSYVINMTGSAMRRISDGRAVRIELDFSDPAIAGFKSLLDGMDIADPFRPNYFRLKVCADILSHDDENAGQIVAE